MAKANGKETKLKITRCTAMYHGKNTKGDEYSIYDIDAEHVEGPKAGQKVNEKLRSFTSMPVGAVIEVTVVPYESERHGKSYTLYPKESVRRGNTEAINELREEVGRLGETIRILHGRVTSLEALADANVRSSATGTAPVTASAAALNEQFGAEPPF